MIKYIESANFQKDFKKLSRKYPTLYEDFKIVKRAAIELFHLHNLNNQSVFEIPYLNGKEPIYKLKKFACKSLKGKGNKSGIRIIYAYNQKNNIIHFIEIYFKGNKENEDKARIRKYLKNQI